MIRDGLKLPTHVAIIMDGNGRWAQARGLPRTAGHKAGAETFRRIATYCSKIGLPYLTVYAFSTENWKRPESEVRTIMELLRKYLLESIEKMVRENIGLRIVGDQSRLPESLRELIARTDELSKQTDGLKVNVCLNYGGRAEITRAVQSIAADCKAGKLAIEDISEETVSRRLYSADVPDPDLMIRPGGEIRLSNFLLWQNAYTEFYFTDVLWPDMDERQFDKAIAAFQQRKRRYGGI